MKKIVAMFMCVIMCGCIFSGCRGGGNITGKSIAMITDYSTVDEDKFYLTIWNAMKKVADEHNVSYSKYTTSDETFHARKEAVDKAVADGAGMIILPSSTFAEVLAEAQKEYPEVKFFGIDIGEDELLEKPADNTYTCAFKEEQAGFLAGYAAVYEGYTKLGFLGGVQLPSIMRFGYGYIQGADMAAVDLQVPIEIKYSYGGQFYGDIRITNQMRDWYTDGTEIVFACGGPIYTSVLDAALESNGMIIGVDVDQNEDGANYQYNPFLTSAIKGLSEITSEVVTHYVEDTWQTIGGNVESLGLEQGDYVGLPAEGATWRFKKFTHSLYDEVCSNIKDKKIVVSSDIQNFPEVSDYTTIIID